LMKSFPLTKFEAVDIDAVFGLPFIARRVGRARLWEEVKIEHRRALVEGEERCGLLVEAAHVLAEVDVIAVLAEGELHL